jgi:hypothetical protein
MKKYMKNKNFIPEKFYKNKELNKNKRENGFIVLILILNLMLLPITTKGLGESKKITLASSEGINNIKSDKIDISKINIWIESILKDDIDSAYISKNSGEITVDNMDNIEKISSNKFIEIDEISLKENGKYKLAVRLYE